MSKPTIRWELLNSRTEMETNTKKHTTPVGLASHKQDEAQVARS